MKSTDDAPGGQAALHHILALDGLRGLAVLGVMGFHFSNDIKDLGHDTLLCRPLQIGWVGVDLFFVLSGFLITGILLEARDKPHYFRNFYSRRTLRIFPLYFLVFAVVAILCLNFRTVAQWAGASLRTQRWYWAYAANILLTLRGDWVGPLDFSWSLAIEEHFYLLWPLAVLLLTRRQLLAACAALIAVAIGLRCWLSAAGYPQIVAYVLTPCRMDGLAAGAAVAILLSTPNGRQALVRWTWPLIGVTLAAIIAVYIKAGGYNDMRPLVQCAGYTLSAIFFAVIVALAAFPAVYRPRLIIATLEFPFLRFIGRYSYGMYVFHCVLASLRMWLFRNWTASSNILFFVCYMAAGLAITLIPATLSWHLFEKPILGLRRYFQSSEPHAPRVGNGAVQAAALLHHALNTRGVPGCEP